MTELVPRRRRCCGRLLPAGSYAGRSRALLVRSATASRGGPGWRSSPASSSRCSTCWPWARGSARWSARCPGPDGAPISYAAFIAPGLLAASAMNGAVFDSTFNVFFKLKYSRLYDAMLATPLGPVDIALGEIGWALIRGGLYALGFLTVMAGFGLLVSPWALLALPAALLVAFAFAAVGMAATSYMRSWQDFDLVTLAVLPMFLFSTTFYPLSVYPRWLQIVVECLPLYHAVELMRGLTTGAVHVGHARPSGLLRGHDRGRGGRRGPPAGRAAAAVSPCGPTPVGRLGWPGVRGQVDNVAMTVTSQRSALLDLVRSAVVALLAVVQIVVSALAGAAVAFGEPVGRGRRRLPHAAAAAGLGVRHLGADLPRVPRLRRSTSCCPRSAAATIHRRDRLVAGRLGGVQHRAGSWPSGPAGCRWPSC